MSTPRHRKAPQRRSARQLAAALLPRWVTGPLIARRLRRVVLDVEAPASEQARAA